jgi:hypothetical protein
MFIEVKTNNAKLTFAQQDTLSIFNQIIRNRRTNIHRGKTGRHLVNNTPMAMAYSYCLDDYITLRMFGGHLLQFSGTYPEDSNTIKWDFKEINKTQLIELLRFEIDPDSFVKMDWRRRYSNFDNKQLLLELA